MYAVKPIMIHIHITNILSIMRIKNPISINAKKAHFSSIPQHNGTSVEWYGFCYIYGEGFTALKGYNG